MGRNRKAEMVSVEPQEKTTKDGKKPWDVYYGHDLIGQVRAMNYQDAYQDALTLARQKFGDKTDPNKIRLDDEVRHSLARF